VKSVRIAVPANGGIPGNISVIATRPDATQASWIVDQTQTGYRRVRECATGDGCYVSGANNDIGPGGTIAVQFTTTANENVTSAPVQEVWDTTAFSDAQWTSALPLAPPVPTVGIGAAPSITSAAAATFSYGAAGTFKVTTNGVPTPALTESGALPGGVNFTDDGHGTATLAGTPGAAGSYPVSITAHNGYGSDAVQNFLLTVNKADQTITFAPLGNKTYGDAAFAVSASGGGSGNPVAFASSTPGTCTTTGANGSTVTLVAAGMCSITASQAGNANYNAATDVAQSFTVNQAQLAITVTGTQVYGGTDKGFTPTQYASFVNGETASVLKGTLACTTDAANNSPVLGTYSVTGCSGLSDSNYNITYVSGGFTVTPAPLSAMVTGTQVYGGTGQSFTPVFSGFVLGEGPGVLTGTLACATNATASSPVPGNYTVSSCSGLSDSNYKISYMGGSFTVTPAPLTITVTGTQVYGGTAKSFAPASYATFVNNEGPAVLSGTLACTTNALNISPVGSYTVTGCSGLTDANYNISYVSGGFTVTPAPLIVTASSGSMTYGGPAFLAVPLYAGFVNGETPANLTAQAACLNLATSASPVGTYSSSCSGAADPNYTISYVAGNVMVTQATTSIALATSLSPSTYMQLVTFTATVSPQYSGAATGTVTFYDTVNGVTTSLGTGTLSVVNGQDVATLSTTGLQDQYPNSITAVYGGDTNFLNSSAAALTQTVNPAPVVSLDPLSLSFGNQNVSTTSKGAPITLKNIGDAPLNISPNGIYITGDNATEFAQTNNCGSTVPAGGSCVITVTFTPADTGVATASLQIVDNDDDTVSAQQIVSLTGAGLSSIGGGSLYSDAIFATANSCGSIVLSGGSTVDSFNSSQGYNASHQLSGGNVGTNGNITLSGGKSAIYGSAVVPSLSTGNCSKTGVTGLTSTGGAQVTGGPVQLKGLVTYPTPPPPVPAPPTTTQSISGSCPAGLAGCSNMGSKTVSVAPGQYGNLTVGGGTTAHLQRGTYNLNSLTLSGKSILYVDSGPVVVNLAGTLSGGSPAMDVTGGSIQNPTGNPANLQFIYAGSRGMNLSGGSGSYAAVYAPNALVNLSGGSDFYGSIVGSTVTNSGGTAIHYDSSLADIQGGNYIWFTAVVNNLKNIGSAPVTLYLNNSTISFTAGGTPYTVPVPNAVIHLNTNAASATTSYDLANSRWITSIPVGGVTGNTFATGVAFQVPTDFPTGIQDVTFSASFTTDTPGVTLQWQWGAAAYNSSFSVTYANGGNNNLLGVNPEDGTADTHGTDAAGTPEGFKNNVVFGGTGGGVSNYTGYLSTGAGVVPTLAPLSVSPATLSFAPQSQGTTSAVQTAVLTNNDAEAHTISSLQITGSSASDYAQTNNCVGSLAPGASCSISITFSPSVIGTRTASIVINDPANTVSPPVVYLSGAGQ
jgi:Bacterial Ig-like domain (group 3)/MBG domain (YGX type)/Abnormal spindle-like microcephaly-assoc'd, ASPM-SPD-2-Hydin